MLSAALANKNAIFSTTVFINEQNVFINEQGQVKILLVKLS